MLSLALSNARVAVLRIVFANHWLVDLRTLAAGRVRLHSLALVFVKASFARSDALVVELLLASSELIALDGLVGARAKTRLLAEKALVGLVWHASAVACRVKCLTFWAFLVAEIDCPDVGASGETREVSAHLTNVTVTFVSADALSLTVGCRALPIRLVLVLASGDGYNESKYEAFHLK